MQQSPVLVQHLFAPLDEKLLELLRSLTPDEWHTQTIAKLWKVKDVTSHLLDGNLRTLSIQKEKYFGERPPQIDSYKDLVDWLNQLNADWVSASKRISPTILILLHEATRKQTSEYYESVDLSEKAIFAVSWAGDEESLNWMHIAREYTEKWLHQQQIRDAVNKQGIMTKEFFYPLIDTFMYALPHTYKNVDAAENTIIEVQVSSEIGGSWFLVRKDNKWLLKKKNAEPASAKIAIEPDAAWKLFSKSLRPKDVSGKFTVEGNEALALHALEMISVMA